MFLRKVLGKEEETSSPVCNVVLIGFYKTELFKAFCGEISTECSDSENKPSVCFREKEFNTYNGDTIALNIWEINGEGKNYEKALSQYCRGAHGVLLCYNQLDSYSSNHIKSFADENSALLSKTNISIQVVCVFRERKKLEKQKVSQKEVEPVAKRIGAKISNCYLNDIESINEVFKSLVADITKKSKIKFKTVRDLPPKPLIQPPKPPSSQEGDEGKETPVSLVSLCRYKYAEMEARKEVRRNEDGLFGNYRNYNKWMKCLYYKVSVLGNPRIGKSCLCARYLKGEFNKKSESDRLWVRSFNLPNRISLRLRMCEGPLPQGGADEKEDKEHFSRSHAVLLCYDITDRASFEAVAAVAAGVRADAMGGAVMMVVGLRYDDEGHVKVSGEEGRALADANGMMFRECSAADNVGVREVFTSILSELQQADLFALPINADDAKRTLKPSVLPSGTKEYKENPQLASLLSDIIAQDCGEIDGKGMKERDERGYDYLFKIMLVSGPYSGKTSLLLRYVDGTYTDSYMSSIGVDFKMKTIRTPNNTIVRLQIWHLNERDYGRYNVYCRSYRCARAVILCFDTTNQESFDAMKEKVDEVERHAPRDAIVVIVGTKSDLPPVVDPVAAREYAKSLGFPLLYCSSKTGDGVDKVFTDTTAYIGYRNDWDFGFDFE